MMELLDHLLPDLSALGTGEPAGLVTGFWLVMTLLLALAAGFLLRHYLLFAARMRILRHLLDEAEQTGPVRARSALREQAANSRIPGVAAIWNRLDQSLVLSVDQQTLHLAEDANRLLDVRALAPGLTSSRLLAATPSFLVAIGVLGTFVGLTVGLADLQVRASEVEELKVGIDQLIAGAAVAFMTSVWGVFYSLLLNLTEKLLERSALWRARRLQQRVEGIYPRIAVEQTLLEMAEYGRLGHEALRQLDRTLAERMTESLDALGQRLERGVADSLGPMLQELSRSTRQQGNAAGERLERLVGQFSESLQQAGAAQGRQMQESTERLDSSLAELGSNLANMVQILGAQNQQQYQLLEGLEHSREALGSAAAHLDGSSASLERMTRDLAATQERLGEGLERTAGTLETIMAQGEHMATEHARALEGLNTLRNGLAETGERLLAASEQARGSFDGLTQQQRQFLEQLQALLGGTTEELQRMIGGLEARSAEWLENYGRTVNAQIEERMQAWNEHTLQFVDEMTRTVQALSELVDDLEARS
ncbi:MAG: anti-phage ZorAB system protein ZorA [Halothiobacillaceae bacterium]